MNEKTLKIVLAGLTIFAVIAISIPFIESLAPTKPATGTATRIDISGLAPGTYREFGPDNRRYFLLRDFDEKIHLFSILRWTEGYALADVRWATANYICADFGPDSSGEHLEAEGKFRCRDQVMPDWYRTNLVWDYSGRNTGQHIEDMQEEGYELYRDSALVLDAPAQSQE